MIKIRVVLADDHPIVLNGLRNLLRTEDDLDLVGEATDGLSALRIIREKQPDVAVIDISMPELSGILLSRRLAEEIKNVKVIVLTLHEDRAYLKQALAAGVRGYVLKRSAAESWFKLSGRSWSGACTSIPRSQCMCWMQPRGGRDVAGRVLPRRS
jgi:DNA-binding NarL/FixJ family response regulator